MRSVKEVVREIAPLHGLDPLLVEAVIQQESSGKPGAFRHEPAFYLRYLKKNPEYAGLDPIRISSSYGLMQVMYSTAREHGFEGDPEELFLLPTNIEIGCRVLSGLMKRFKGDVLTALAGYNGGPGNVHAKIPLEYARKVMLRYETSRKAHSKGDHRILDPQRQVDHESRQSV